MSLRFFFIVFLAVTLVSQGLALGAVDNVLRNASQLKNAEKTQNIRVEGVKVVVADYDLIARDFPMQRIRRNETVQEWHDRVDLWLVHETAFIMLEQSLPNEVNTPISVGDEVKTTFRPSFYRRGHVIPVSEGLMDAKGSGTANPKQGSHSNGLATLGELIREYIFEKAIAQIMEHSRSGIKTVGIYAVMDFGFDVVNEDGTHDRAGYILRQAKRRSSGFISLLPTPIAFKVEKILRRYGLTSSGETMKGEFLYDYLNVQGTDNLETIELVDFGAYMAVEKFSRPLVTTQDIRNPYAVPLTAPVRPDYVQPDPDLRVPLEKWGDTGTHDPQKDKLWAWSHDLARAWAKGTASRETVLKHINTFLRPMMEKLEKTQSGSHAQKNCEVMKML